MLSNSHYLLNFTPTGMVPTKEITPYVPTQPEEIAQQVLEAAELGANMTHLHARTAEDDTPTHIKEIYADIIYRIRKFDKDIIICVSTSGRNVSEIDKRSECLDLTGELKPDFGSLTLSSLNFSRSASINSPQTVTALAQKMKNNGIKPELEIFDLGMVNYAKYLISKGVVVAPYYFNVILGNIASAQASLLDLGVIEKELPQESYWTTGGIGRAQLRMNVAGLNFANGVRVGIEDNIYFDQQETKLASNNQLIQRVIELALLMGKTPYSSSKAREMLGVSKG